MRITLLLALLLVFNFSFAQKSDEERRKTLDEIAQKSKANYEVRKQRVDAYVQEKGVAKRFITDENQTIEIYDIDKNGNPIYIATDNQGAAVTTGADYLRDEGGIGLNLQGKGVKIGVWDGGAVRTSHIEFDSDVAVMDDFSTLNFHATHVTGTITAKGVNEAARGMAPEATVFTHHWDDDEAEMVNLATSGQSGIILSNHSYGIPGGWVNGSWNGDPSISTLEDWKFGFYDESSRILDEIAYNAPYYLIARSGGNERDDAGDGSFPPDGPYDNIGLAKVAKNVLTVGAVNKIPSGYTSKDDVVMSRFSSWGPTDDGRIKPDLVGAGVGILSTEERNDQDYRVRNGTSMATPNVVGTLALLQELNKRITGNYLKSSALKGLAIHTIYEAGQEDGPDYSFGWGLMNAKGAADHILSENGINKIIKNIVLQDGETYSFEIQPTERSEVKITICWTDVPGTPTAIQLDPSQLMLVNDLDLRVSNSTEQYLPYILDPANPELPATKGDNFRDNIEKIEFSSSSSEPHTVTVSHKGSLTNNFQEFSIIVSYESSDANTYYRVGSSSDWTGGNYWSLSSGGSPVLGTPGPKDVLIFDSNSYSQASGGSSSENKLIYNIDTDLEVGKLVFIGEREVDVMLGDNNLVTYGGVSVGSGNVNFIGTGAVVLKDNIKGNYPIVGSENSFIDVDVVVDFDKESIATISGQSAFKSITVNNGGLNLINANTTIGSLIVSSQSVINFDNVDLQIDKQFEVAESADINIFNIEINANDEADAMSFSINEKNIDGYLKLASGNLTISGDFDVNLLESSSTLHLTGNVNAENLVLNQGSQLMLNADKSLTIEDELKIISTPENTVSLEAIDGVGSMIINGRRILCYDYLNIDGINAMGEATFNAGINSNLNNSTGWQQRVCNEVLFADFDTETVCAGGIKQFSDRSKGVVNKWEWYLDDELVSNEQNPYLDFSELKTYEVRLEVFESEENIQSFSRTVETIENNLPENEILLSGNQLVSRSPADSYQWYVDGNLLEGETGRTINVIGKEGVFFVVAENETCTRKSPEFEFRITSADEDLFDTEYSIFPNPASAILNVDVKSSYSGSVQIRMTDLSGRKIFDNSFEKNGFQLLESVNTTGLPNGLYVITISQGQSETSKLVAIEQ